MNPITFVHAAFLRLRVSQQLYGAFAALLLLTAAVGGLALVDLSRVDAQARALAEKWLAGVGQLAATRSALIETRELEIKHSRAQDRSYQAEYEDKIAQANQSVATALAAYAGLVTSDDERALLATLKKDWASYEQAQHKILAFGRDKRRQDAIDVSDGLGSTAFDQTTTALDALTRFGFEGGQQAAAQANAIASSAQRTLIGLLGAALLLGMAFAVLIARQLLRQLGGEPATAVAVAQAAAEGDLSMPIALRAGDTDSLLARLSAMQRGLADAVSAVRRGSESVATSSAEIAHGNQDLSRRTEQQAAALEETSASMEQLGATVKQNADNARQANQLALGASEVAVKGGEVVGHVVATMKDINESSKKIADIIGVIDGIAFQTNILALNAAVEAARAGEQG